MGGAANCNVGPSREIDMYGGQGLGPASGPGLAPGPGQGQTKQKSKKKYSSTAAPAIDWSARMLDMKRINTLIRSKEEEDAYWMKLRNTNRDHAVGGEEEEGDDGMSMSMCMCMSYMYEQ